MTLSHGSELGPYSIDSEIGRGGMGVVYRARDSRLGRDAAIKALPEVFLADEARLSRFQREAKTLASLNHGNIAQIYGLEEQDSHQFLVLEYVEGETLGERLDRGQLAMDEALIICAGIATGVEAAHEADVVHRDLKPGNIKITPGGEVKVLDFGLAKSGTAPSRASSEINTITKPDDSVTAAGLVLGTPAYMSPEQARGKELDKRTDIWAFGVILYECLTGLKPFAGETATDSIAAILERDPDFDALPNRTPPAVRALVKHCLEKDANRRLRDIGDARILLDDAVATRAWTTTAIQAAHGQIRARSRRALSLWAASLLVAVGATMTAMWWTMPASTDTAVRKYPLSLGVPMGSVRGGEISPDGTAVAYSIDGSGLWVRQLDQLEPQLLVEGDASRPKWSPDSLWIQYTTRPIVYKVLAEDGGPMPVGSLPNTPTANDWGDDGQIYYGLRRRGRGGGVIAFPEGAGDFIEVLAADEINAVTGLCVLPNGGGIVYATRDDSRRWVLELRGGSGEKKVLLELQDELAAPAYSPTGHILFARGGSNGGVWALPFSLAEGEPTGRPFLVAPNGSTPSVSDNGILVYHVGALPGTSGGEQLVWIDREGKELRTLGRTQQAIRNAQLSPDGRRIMTQSDDSGEGFDIWVHESDRPVATPITFDGTVGARPRWVGNEGDLVFSSGGPESAIYRLNVGSNGAPEELAKGNSPTVAPDGSSMVFQRDGDLWRMDLDGPKDPELFYSPPADEFYAGRAKISPDGTYVGYVSNETGEPTIYLKRYPSGEGKTVVMERVGNFWLWSKDSKKIYFIRSGDLYEVDVDLSGEEPVVGLPQEMFDFRALGLDLAAGFDISEDGEQFLIVRGVGVEPGTGTGDAEIVVVENWFEEFRDREDR